MPPYDDGLSPRHSMALMLVCAVEATLSQAIMMTGQHSYMQMKLVSMLHGLWPGKAGYSRA